jgi:hypothetical protein
MPSQGREPQSRHRGYIRLRPGNGVHGHAMTLYCEDFYSSTWAFSSPQPARAAHSLPTSSRGVADRGPPLGTDCTVLQAVRDVRSIDTLRVARGHEPYVLFACRDKFNGKAPQCSPYCTTTYEEKLMSLSRAVDNSYRAGAGHTCPCRCYHYAAGSAVT